MKNDRLTKAIASELARSGMSKRDFARRLGVSHSTPNHWLDGTTPEPDNLRRIEEVLDVQPRGRLLKLAAVYMNGHDVPPPSIEDAIAADETLTDRDRTVLFAVLQGIRQMNEAGRTR
jgi:transcriptional regulator with XRE-family HTH domain